MFVCQYDEIFEDCTFRTSFEAPPTHTVGIIAASTETVTNSTTRAYSLKHRLCPTCAENV